MILVARATTASGTTTPIRLAIAGLTNKSVPFAIFTSIVPALSPFNIRTTISPRLTT